MVLGGIMGSGYVLQVFFVKAGSGPRPRTKRVKNDCTLSADYYNINKLNYYILYYYEEPSQPKPEMEL